MLEWHVIPAATYYSAEPSSLNDDYLYFLSDTGEIMKGSKPYNQAIEMLTGPSYELPATPARKRIYIHPVTLEGKVYDGTSWVTVIKPVDSAVTASGANPVSGKAVYDHVAAEIAKINSSADVVASMSYSKDAVKLTYTTADSNTHDLLLEGIGVTLSYDKGTGALTMKDISGNVLGTAINLDLERFVNDASYDHDTKKITLTFNDKSTPLEIDVADLVDTYTAENSTTIALTVTNNKFKAEAIVAATEGNMLQKTDSGLYVAATNLDNCQKMIQGATAGNLAGVNSNGQTTDSGVKAGTGTLSGTPNATTLATEAAVKAAIDGLNSSLTALINGKMALVSGATDGDILTVNGSGQAVDSGKKIGTGTLSTSPNANTLATEAAVKAYADTKVDKASVVTSVSASSTDEQVPSAKALYTAMTWKTSL